MAFFFGNKIGFDFSSRPGKSFFGAVLLLIGHLIAAGAVFMAFFLIVWTIAAMVSRLSAEHQLPEEILKFMTQFEVYVMYADSVLCTIVLVAGIFSFVSDIRRMH